MEVLELDQVPFITRPDGQKLCSYSIIVKQLQTWHLQYLIHRDRGAMSAGCCSTSNTFLDRKIDWLHNQLLLTVLQNTPAQSQYIQYPFQTFFTRENAPGPPRKVPGLWPVVSSVQSNPIHHSCLQYVFYYHMHHFFAIILVKGMTEYMYINNPG